VTARGQADRSNRRATACALSSASRQKSPREACLARALLFIEAINAANFRAASLMW
jgi:hypothetical protein